METYPDHGTLLTWPWSNMGLMSVDGYEFERKGPNSSMLALLNLGPRLERTPKL